MEAAEYKAVARRAQTRANTDTDTQNVSDGILKAQ